MKGFILEKCFYDCKYCEKKFTQSQTAKAHERSQTSEKPYACDFAHLRSLKTHETIHTGEKKLLLEL
jgi:uncharacterized Zn-finger protein